MSTNTADVVIIGGGVVGLTVAHTLLDRDASLRVTVLDKEASCGEHASGRNSGVLHAGFYYGEDSLKARYCVEGNRLMKLWCEDNDVPVRHAGKLVVAANADEETALDGLYERGQRNGADVSLVSEDEARELEPRARTHGRALYSPSTASVDPAAVMAKLAVTGRARGIDIQTSTAFVGRVGTALQTTRGRIDAGFVVNAAGLQADRVAAAWGFCQHHRILPFKGFYLYGDVPPGWLNVHIYPVPPKDLPFLGVHFTVTVDGRAKIGPTALPGWWRENYGGLQGFDAGEMVEVIGREAAMFLRDGSFRRLALRELPKASRRWLARRAAPLVDGLDPSEWRRWGRTGIRAQLLDTRTGKLDMDFVVEGDERSSHVLNAVSPAFTCSWALAKQLVERISL